ncbi:hypothetical protein MtrunA17_Chr8g0369471 [Medicago truncatula]|uniref:Uncharacterized protein n=1 Tax=Medicago truncatula TaxID=3880 RepID=A0A396GL58_MEDTR|nr:uncharacterized protein LOC25501569 [Medicago truncatula]RHN41760.1 hypothetical protein MtrunA17_Chr8g0369471 [Medicago truncatula]
MINLFISEPTRNNDANAEEDSTKLRINLLKELETVLWSAIISSGRAEARMWLRKTIAGINCVKPRDQREIFINFMRIPKKKHDLTSQLLNLMFDNSPQKLGSVLARKTRVLDNFFAGDPKRMLQWFSFSGLEQGKGLRALSQFAFKNRDICWEELEWKGKHGQSPAMVATKPHYFLDLDIQRTVENFLDNVPEFWSSVEVSESVKDGDIFLIDRVFFVRYFKDLMYREDSSDVWDVIEDFLEEQPFSCLCEHLLISFEEQDLCYFVELLCKCLDPRIELQGLDDLSRLFVVVLLKCGVSGSIDWILMLNAVIAQGRQLLRLLRDEEAKESLAKVNEIVSKISAIPNDGNSLTPFFNNRFKMEILEVVKCLGLQSWVMFYRLSQECKTPESWESVFLHNQIGFRNSDKHALTDEDGVLSEEDCSGFDCGLSVRVKKKNKHKARKKRRRAYDYDGCNDDELLDFDFASQKLDYLPNAKSWFLSTDQYSSAWNSADLPEHLHRLCLSRWMIWLFEK